MSGKIFSCPLSGEQLAHPCPCHSCPGNLARYSEDRSCAYQLPDLSYASLAEATGLEPGEVRQHSQMQASELAVLVQDLRHVTENVSNGACPNCGYITACKNSTICDERRETVEEILVNCKHVTPLKPCHLWFAITSRHASFIPRTHRETLRELVGARDLGDIE